MGNYSIRNIFTKEPAVIAGAVKGVLFVLVLFGLAVDAKQLAAIGLALELVLTLFVRQTSTPVAEPVIPQGTEVTVITPAGQPDEKVTV